MLTVEEVISLLRLQPHPVEGGYFVETYRSADELAAAALPPRYPRARACSTAIYYLLTPESFSAMHRLRTDEVFHFYMGDAVEMLQLSPDGAGQVVRLGTNLAAGERPQLVVPRGWWQGSRLIPGGRFALLGATVAPGFDYSDYETGRRDPLSQAYPQHRERIALLTRE
jgi:predicted cupin superfamily sugar epimerase